MYQKLDVAIWYVYFYLYDTYKVLHTVDTKNIYV